MALALAAVLSAGLLLLAGVGSLRAWYTRSSVLDFEMKQQSEVLAAACIEQVRTQLVKDPLYTGDAVFAYGDGVCTVGVLHGTVEKSVTVVGEYRSLRTILSVTIDAATVEVLSVTELSTY
jgi:hypothetical protein